MKETPWSDVVRSCLAVARPPTLEKIRRGASLGRLLMEAVHSDRNYPFEDLSTMDGYAVSSDPMESYAVEGENRPGRGPGQALAAGTARRIFTGAALPQGATRVLPQELTRRKGDTLKILEWPSAPYVRPAGCESWEGATILRPGTRIAPLEQSMLAALGKSHVRVAKRPVIGHLVTGDELVDPDTPAARTLIRDSNSELVASSLLSAGYTITHYGRIADDANTITDAIEQFADRCDLLLISGGASVGDYDYARTALRSLGFRFKVHGTHIRPGKPIAMARRGTRWAIALPGNPVSHWVALHLFVIPFLRGLEGEAVLPAALVDGILEKRPSIDSPRRPTFWPAIASIRSGVFQVLPCRFASSGDLLGVAGANALLYLEQALDIPNIGATVKFLPLRGNV